MSTIDALREVLTIPQFKPEFLRHQRKWLWKNKKSHFVKNNWHNSDDVSFIAMYDPNIPPMEVLKEKDEQ